MHERLVVFDKNGKKRHIKNVKPNKQLLGEMLYRKAIYEKDVKAAELILNRTDGKPTEHVNLSGDGDNPARIGIIEVVKDYGTGTND